MLSIDDTGTSDLVRKLSILFVEDDSEVRESMSNYLRRRVNQVYTAQDGVAGLRCFKERDADLVISDVRMWGMDGLEMCRAIRKTDPNIPLIIISAYNESDILLSSIDLGVTKFIVKPVEIDVLMEAIASIALSLEQRRNADIRFQQMDSILNEAGYETERVRGYVSHFLEANHGDEIANIRHLNIPKLDVSGDFYSVAKHIDDLYVMLADGAGHGLSAVIPALQIPGIFQQQVNRGFSLQNIAAEINGSLREHQLIEHFVATTLIRVNQSERFIEVLNCGNPSVLVFGDDGALLHTFHSKSTALGMVGDTEFLAETERFAMNGNAHIYLFTDGLADTIQASYPDFGDNELLALFGNTHPQNIFDSVVSKIEKATQLCKVDDVTLLEIYFDCATQLTAHVEIPPEALLSSEEDMPVALDQMTLLYVEDDDLTRNYLARYLNRRLGMVHLARDGKEGLSLFKKYRPQIVLTDIKMPVMGGLKMAEEIRKLDQEVPIVVTSGSDRSEDAEKMFEMGISRFHMKPLDPGKLMNTIQSCIRKANEINQLRLSSSAFQASSLAVITADRDKCIVDVNLAFCLITGYSLAEVFGRSPTLLSSGKHDANQYQAMWKALDEFGCWSGELLCQHKNGETISEWLTVNALTDMHGEVTGYHFIFSDMSERKMNEEKVRQLMLYDDLTHLPNRAMFADKINALLVQAGKCIECFALVYINLDRFIEINNSLGVHVGDKILFAVGQSILTITEGEDVAYRMGGDEFAVLIPGYGKRESIEQVVVELSRAIKQPIQVNGKEIQLRVSIGIGRYPVDGETYEELLKSACSAMNQAQLAGGDTYRFFDKSVSLRDERQVILQQDIQAGLSKNEFYMLYQPKYSLSQKRVVGAEALVRWNHSTLGLISPVEFIPLAESNGTVIGMSEWIIDTVCAQIADWRSAGLTLVPVSINISPVHFRRGNLVESLRHGLEKWDILSALMPIEVTEGVVMDTSEKTLQVLEQLKALGFHLSIDDFGTGYSSLKYLKDLPISELKIDRSFIVEIPEDGQSDDLSKTAIPRAIIQLASEFNLTVVAEGVETENQKNFLLKNGCDVIQGYLFSRPIPANEFALLLA
jgi:diguanylate cyclase (GGDEF)-like protein/PAS domain S-box-containing protein